MKSDTSIQNLLDRLIRICRIHFLVFTCSVFDQNTLFWWTNWNMQMSMMTFSVFDLKHDYLANLVLKLKIVCSDWNLIQNSVVCPFYLGFRFEIHFLVKFGPKIEYVSLIWCLFILLLTGSFLCLKISSKRS